MNVIDRPSRPPLSPQEGWISDGRQVLQFKPLRYDRWSQALEVTLGGVDPWGTGAAAETAQGADAGAGLAGVFAAVDPAEGLNDATVAGSARQHWDTRGHPVLLNPFCPFSTAKLLALKATVLLLLTLLIKARVQIVAGSAIGIFLLLLQTLVCLAISGGLVLAAGGAAFYATQQRRSVAA
jgi:hypothetical protein